MSEDPSQYEADFYQWSLEQARLLRSGDWKAVDVEHLAEEIEDMGKGVRREWESRLKVLIVHLPQSLDRAAAQMGLPTRTQRNELAVGYPGATRPTP